MLLKRFYDDKLAQASYLVGCAATGEALVIDAHRDVAEYLSAAEQEGMRVTHVTETHIHADFVSGSRELAQRASARLFLSDEGDASWKYAFAHDAGAVLLKEGDSFMVGNIKVQALHTPGAYSEHLSFMITDTRATDRPMGVLPVTSSSPVTSDVRICSRRRRRLLERWRQAPALFTAVFRRSSSFLTTCSSGPATAPARPAANPSAPSPAPPPGYEKDRQLGPRRRDGGSERDQPDRRLCRVGASGQPCRACYPLIYYIIRRRYPYVEDSWAS